MKGESMKTGIKRALALLLAIVMVIGLGVTALADGEGTECTITIDTATGTYKAGDEVTLKVKISDNPGFGATQEIIIFDDSRLELTAINGSYKTTSKDEDGNEIETEVQYLPGLYTVNTNYEITADRLKLYPWLADYCDANGNQIHQLGIFTSANADTIYKNGTMYTLTFKVKEGAETGFASVTTRTQNFQVAGTKEDGSFTSYDVKQNIVSGGINVEGVTPTCKHTNVVAHAAVAADCTNSGNEAYWECKDCSKLFSDEALTTEITAIPTTAALGHNYVDGKCTRCGAAEPAYELYVEFDPAVDSDNDGIIDTDAGQTVNAKLMLRSATDAHINSFDAKVTFDENLTAGTPVANSPKLNYKAIDGGYQFYNYAADFDVKAGVAKQVAVIPVTVNANAPTGVEMAVTPSASAVGVGTSSKEIAVTTTGKSLEINSITVTFVTASGSYDVEYATNEMPSFDDVKDEGATTDKEGYTFTGWDPELAAVTGKVTYTAQYKANEYTVTFVDENGDVVEEVPFTYEEDKTITEPSVPAKDGYEGVWGEYDLTKPEDQTVHPTYTAKKYTITYEVDGGDEKAAVEYTIEDTTAIGSATKDGYTFIGWKVEEADGSWVKDADVAADDTVTGKYGNVTLKAQWVVTATIKFEDYAYATSEQVLLIVEADKLESGNYLFDGQPLYWTDSTDYGAKGAYVTLVDAKWAAKSAEEAAKALTIDTEAAVATKIDRDGDVNGDGKITITDAGVVYKMLSTNGDAFDDMSILDRLECDVVTSQSSAAYRGSIADVNAIMDVYLAK